MILRSREPNLRLVCAPCCRSIFSRQRRLRGRKLPIPNGSFLEAQFQSLADPSAVIHHGQHRPHCGSCDDGIGGHLTALQRQGLNDPNISKVNLRHTASP